MENFWNVELQRKLKPSIFFFFSVHDGMQIVYLLFFINTYLFQSLETIWSFSFRISKTEWQWFWARSET